MNTTAQVDPTLVSFIVGFVSGILLTAAVYGSSRKNVSKVLEPVSPPQIKKPKKTDWWKDAGGRLKNYYGEDSVN